MRVAFLINDLRKVGGAERLVCEMAEKLADNGHNVDIILLNPRCEHPLTDRIKLRSFSFSCLISLLRSDVVHVNLFPSLYLGALLAFIYRLRGVKFIYHEHNIHNRRRETRFLRFVESLVYSNYTSVICISNAVKSSLESWLMWGQKKIIVIHNFSNISVGLPRRSLSSKPVKIGMAGALSAQKDQDFLVRFLTERGRNSYELNLIGGNFEKYRALEDAKIKIWDDPSRIIEFYDYLDVYVHAAHWEGFGLVAIEACRRGRPILLPDLPGMNEICRLEPYLYKPGDINDFSVKLDALCDEYEAAVRNCTQVAQKFSIETFMEDYMKLLSE